MKQFIRLIAILVIECFIISSIAPDYEEITAISRNDYSDNYIGSLSGSPPFKETALRQARLFLNQEAPDSYLAPPLKLNKLSKNSNDKDQIKFEHLLSNIASDGGAPVPRFLLTDDEKIWISLDGLKIEAATEDEFIVLIREHYSKQIGSVIKIQFIGRGAYSLVYKVETDRGVYALRHDKKEQLIILQEFIKGEAGDWNKVDGARLESAARALAKFHNSTHYKLSHLRPFQAERSKYLMDYPLVDVSNLDAALNKLEQVYKILQNRSPPPDSPEAYFLNNFEKYKSHFTILRDRIQKTLDDPRLEWAVIHGDYHPENVHWMEEEVTGILDFNYSAIAPRIVDLANVMEETDDKFDITKIRLFLGAYQSYQTEKGRQLTDLEVEILPEMFRRLYLQGVLFQAYILAKPDNLDIDIKNCIMNILRNTTEDLDRIEKIDGLLNEQTFTPSALPAAPTIVTGLKTVSLDDEGALRFLRDFYNERIEAKRKGKIEFNPVNMNGIVAPLEDFLREDYDPSGVMQALIDFLKVNKDDINSDNLDEFVKHIEKVLALNERTEIAVRTIRHDEIEYFDLINALHGPYIYFSQSGKDAVERLKEILKIIYERIEERREKIEFVNQPFISFEEARDIRIAFKKICDDLNNVTAKFDAGNTRHTRAQRALALTENVFMGFIYGNLLTSYLSIDELITNFIKMACGYRERNKVTIAWETDEEDKKEQQFIIYKEKRYSNIANEFLVNYGYPVHFNVSGLELSVIGNKAYLTDVIRLAVTNSVQVAAERYEDENGQTAKEAAEKGIKIKPLEFNISIKEQNDGLIIEISLMDNVGGVSDPWMLEEIYPVSGRQNITRLNTSRRRKDTGLGLCKVYWAVRLMGGTMKCYNLDKNGDELPVTGEAVNQREGFKISIRLPSSRKGLTVPEQVKLTEATTPSSPKKEQDSSVIVGDMDRAMLGDMLDDAKVLEALPMVKELIKEPAYLRHAMIFYIYDKNLFEQLVEENLPEKYIDDIGAALFRHPKEVNLALKKFSAVAKEKNISLAALIGEQWGIRNLKGWGDPGSPAVLAFEKFPDTAEELLRRGWLRWETDGLFLCERFNNKESRKIIIKLIETFGYTADDALGFLVLMEAMAKYPKETEQVLKDVKPITQTERLSGNLIYAFAILKSTTHTSTAKLMEVLKFFDLKELNEFADKVLVVSVTSYLNAFIINEEVALRLHRAYPYNQYWPSEAFPVLTSGNSNLRMAIEEIELLGIPIYFIGKQKVILYQADPNFFKWVIKNGSKDIAESLLKFSRMRFIDTEFQKKVMSWLRSSGLIKPDSDGYIIYKLVEIFIDLYIENITIGGVAIDKERVGFEWALDKYREGQIPLEAIEAITRIRAGEYAKGLENTFLADIPLAKIDREVAKIFMSGPDTPRVRAAKKLLQNGYYVYTGTIDEALAFPKEFQDALNAGLDFSGNGRMISAIHEDPTILSAWRQLKKLDGLEIFYRRLNNPDVTLPRIRDFLKQLIDSMVHEEERISKGDIINLGKKTGLKISDRDFDEVFWEEDYDKESIERLLRDINLTERLYSHNMGFDWFPFRVRVYPFGSHGYQICLIPADKNDIKNIKLEHYNAMGKHTIKGIAMAYINLEIKEGRVVITEMQSDLISQSDLQPNLKRRYWDCLNIALFMIEQVFSENEIVIAPPSVMLRVWNSINPRTAYQAYGRIPEKFGYRMKRLDEIPDIRGHLGEKAEIDSDGEEIGKVQEHWFWVKQVSLDERAKAFREMLLTGTEATAPAQPAAPREATDEIFLSKIEELDGFVHKCEEMSSEEFVEMEILNDIKELAKEILLLFAETPSLVKLLTATPQGNKIWKNLYISGLLMMDEILIKSELRKGFRQRIYGVIKVYSILEKEKIDIIVETEEKQARGSGFITTGKIRSCIDNPKALLGTLFHEVSHVIPLSINISFLEEMVEKQFHEFLGDIGAVLLFEYLNIEQTEYLNFIREDVERYEQRYDEDDKKLRVVFPKEWTPEYQRERDEHYIPRRNFIERVLPLKLRLNLSWMQILATLINCLNSIKTMDDFQEFIDQTLIPNIEIESEPIMANQTAVGTTAPAQPAAPTTEREPSPLPQRSDFNNLTIDQRKEETREILLEIKNETGDRELIISNSFVNKMNYHIGFLNLLARLCDEISQVRFESQLSRNQIKEALLAYIKTEKELLYSSQLPYDLERQMIEEAIEHLKKYFQYLNLVYGIRVEEDLEGLVQKIRFVSGSDLAKARATYGRISDAYGYIFLGDNIGFGMSGVENIVHEILHLFGDRCGIEFSHIFREGLTQHITNEVLAVKGVPDRSLTYSIERLIGIEYEMANDKKRLRENFFKGIDIASDWSDSIKFAFSLMDACLVHPSEKIRVLRNIKSPDFIALTIEYGLNSYVKAMLEKQMESGEEKDETIGKVEEKIAQLDKKRSVFPIVEVDIMDLKGRDPLALQYEVFKAFLLPFLPRIGVPQDIINRGVPEDIITEILKQARDENITPDSIIFVVIEACREMLYDKITPESLLMGQAIWLEENRRLGEYKDRIKKKKGSESIFSTSPTTPSTGPVDIPPERPDLP